MLTAVLLFMLLLVYHIPTLTASFTASFPWTGVLPLASRYLRRHSRTTGWAISNYINLAFPLGSNALALQVKQTRPSARLAY